MVIFSCLMCKRGFIVLRARTHDARVGPPFMHGIHTYIHIIYILFYTFSFVQFYYIRLLWKCFIIACIYCCGVLRRKVWVLAWSLPNVIEWKDEANICIQTNCALPLLTAGCRLVLLTFCSCPIFLTCHLMVPLTFRSIQFSSCSAASTVKNAYNYTYTQMSSCTHSVPSQTMHIP